ncbi:MAG: kelch repeat-containing protein, partial [Myxococcota bacterium]
MRWAVAGAGALTLSLALVAAACGEAGGVRGPSTAVATAVTAEARARAVEVLAGKHLELAQRLSTGRLVPWQAAPGGEGATSLALPAGFTQPLSVALPASGAGAVEVALGAVKVTLRPVGADASSKLERSGTYAVYANQYPATDGFVVGGSDFVEALWLLKDEAGPRRFEWEVDAPGWMKRLRLDADGGASLLNQQDAVVLRVRPPVAVDGEGRRLDCRLEVTGTRLAVALREEPRAYPVLVDPVVELPGWNNMAPSVRQFHAMATLGTKVVLFGGKDTNSTSSNPLSDTWEWDGTNWIQRFPATNPPARAYHAMATLGAKVVLFGGRGTSNTLLSDTWEWDGTNWTQRSPATSPPARHLHAM